MPALSKNEAAEKLAQVVQKAEHDDLEEFYAELFPERPVPTRRERFGSARSQRA